MNQTKKDVRAVAASLAVLLLAAIAGCHTGGECCNDIAPGAIPQPNGTYDCQWIHAEMARAKQENFVIYQYEWITDGAQLTPSGQEHVCQIAKTLACVPYPVVIEPGDNCQLDGWRKAAVLEALAKNCASQS